jgi:hypothetical protein
MVRKFKIGFDDDNMIFHMFHVSEETNLALRTIARLPRYRREEVMACMKNWPEGWERKEECEEEAKS